MTSVDLSRILKKLTRKRTDASDLEKRGREAIDNRELLISTNPVDDIIVDDANRPVWPVYTSLEFQSLQEIAKLFELTIHEVTAHHGPSSTGDETVAGLGEGAFEPARLYAHLTGRQFRPLDKLSNWGQMDSQPAVIVVPLEQLNNELLSTLYADTRNHNITGIICGEKNLLRRQVLVRAAAASFLGQPRVRTASVFPLWREGRIFINNTELPDSSSERVRSIVESQAGILAVQTHSDGMDAMLGPTLTLCPLDQPPSSADRARSNRCIQTDWCHRSRTNISTFLSSPSFLSPDSFSAHILLWDVCWGAIPPAGLIDPAWGIGKRFLDSPRLGAVLAPWDLSLSSPKLVSHLIKNLESGVNVGEALLVHNLSMEAQRFRHRMCLFGDPRVSLGPAANEDQPTTPHLKVEPVKTRVARLRTKESTGFLGCLVGCMIARPSYGGAKLGEFGIRAMSAIQNYEQTTQAGLETEMTSSSVGPMLRSAVLACIRRRGPVIFNEWFKEAVPVSSKFSSRCFACQCATTTFVTTILSIPGFGLRRRVSRCQRCGVVEDVPVETSMTLSIGSDRCVRLSGNLPSEAWQAQFLIRQQHTRRRSVFDWPAESNGKPVDNIQLPDSLPVGLLQAGLVMMHRADVYSLTQFIRGDEVNLDLQTQHGTR